MPLERLLAMYGYSGSEQPTDTPSSSSFSPSPSTPSLPSKADDDEAREGDSIPQEGGGGGGGEGGRDSSRGPPDLILVAEPQPERREEREEALAAIGIENGPPGLIHVPLEQPPPPPPSLPNTEPVAGSSTVEEPSLPVGRRGGVLEREKEETGNVRKGPWYRPGADPEALARLRPVPERRSMRLTCMNNEPHARDHGDNMFSE